MNHSELIVAGACYDWNPIENRKDCGNLLENIFPGSRCVITKLLDAVGEMVEVRFLEAGETLRVPAEELTPAGYTDRMFETSAGYASYYFHEPSPDILDGMALKASATVRSAYTFTGTGETNPDLAVLVKNPDLDRALAECENAAKDALENVKTAITEWENAAKLKWQIACAMEYQRITADKDAFVKSTTENVWKTISRSEHSCNQKISNAVYSMGFSVWSEGAPLDDENSTGPWRLSWDVSARSYAYLNGCYGIAGQEKMRFKDKAKMEAYIEGRKKAYAHLFTEMWPKIPKKYAGPFMLYGVLLPGYTVEE